MWNNFWTPFVFGAVALVAVIAYAEHRDTLLEMQEPIVTTCIQHRVSQKVFVQR